MSGVKNPVDVTAALNGVLTTRGDILRRGAATAERLGLGASGNTVESDGTDVLYGAGGAGGAVTRKGGNTTEATTTSTTAVDLLTAASLSIAVGEPILAFASLRKASGGSAGDALCGIKVNTVVVLEAGVPTEWSGTTNQSRAGYWQAIISPRSANYLRTGILMYGGNGNVDLEDAMSDGDFPNAEITDLIVRGEVSNSNFLMGAVDLQVYSLSI